MVDRMTCRYSITMYVELEADSMDAAEEASYAFTPARLGPNVTNVECVDIVEVENVDG